MDEMQENREQETVSDQGDAPKKKSRKKHLIIWGSVAAVFVILIAAGLVWHNSPSFCGTICHNPMAPYVEGYDSNDTNLLVASHKAQGNTCLDCHDATITEQIHEAQVWLTGNFTTPLAPSGIATNEFCLSCHDREKIVAATDNYSKLDNDVATEFGGLNRGLNPHRSHMEDLQCGDCHSMHSTSVMQCNSCHYLPLPDGWTDAWDGAGSDVK